MVLKAAWSRGEYTKEEQADYVSGLRSMPSLINTALEQKRGAADEATKLSSHARAVSGRAGAMFPLALRRCIETKRNQLYDSAKLYASES